MLSNSAAVCLKHYLELDSSFRRVVLADARGVAVTRTRKPIDYNQSDENWWTNSLGDGRSCRIYVEDVRYDAVTWTNFAGISASILDPEGYR